LVSSASGAIPALIRTRFQKYRTAVVPRSQIQGFPRNPRKIDAYAKQRLEKNLRSVGLLLPLVVNERQGLNYMQLVSGHQRLAALDALEEGTDYGVECALVSLTPKQHAEQLLFFNNYHAQGAWTEELFSLVRDEEIDITAAGFEPFDLQFMADQAGVEWNASEVFSPESRPTEVQSLEESLGAIKPSKAAKDAEKKALSPEEELAAQIERRHQHLEKSRERDDGEVYLVLVLSTPTERSLFASWFGMDERERYLSAERFRERLRLAGVAELP
jgi:hypothetical protein